MRWTEELHQRKGNVLFADGHVERFNQATFTLAANGGGGPNVVLPDPTHPDSTPGLFPQPKPATRHEPEAIAQNSARRAAAASAQNPVGNNAFHWVSLPLARFPVADAVWREWEIRSNATRGASLGTNPPPTQQNESETGARDWVELLWLRKVIAGGYALLLLLLLLLLAYALWRQWRKRRERAAPRPVTRPGEDL